jgi:ribosomal protein L40E
VRRDSQVLICPRCQATDDWTADLARCPRCGSVHLVRRLGEVECRDCGMIVPPSAAPGEGEPLTETTVTGTTVSETTSGPSPDLSEEVARALERVLSRGLMSQSTPRTGADSH